jgi:hypothetical protein
MERPCSICLFSFEEHKPFMQEKHLFCPDQDLSEGPAEAFYCYVPCGNLQFLEHLDKRRVVTNE